jgi:UDP-3-O-[3-hydroxymyristoyl] glucosamine N-acyltransferase
MLLKSLLSLEKYGLKHLQGSLDGEVTQVKPPEDASPNSLVFVAKPEFAEKALSLGARAFAKTPGWSFQFPQTTTVFEVPSISAGMAMLLPFFDPKSKRFEHSSQNFVHPTAKIGANVMIGFGSFIGANTVIGDGTKIGTQVTIENDCKIGANCIFHSQVLIGTLSEIGKECEIHPHTTIGSDGFGYVTDPATGLHHKIPQIGKVVIEDRVEIGANCAIDRATLTETRIKAGTKIDNLVHIAHNCQIGENAILVAGFMTAGSSKFGKQFVAAGQSAISDHVTITDHVTLAGRTGVTSDITESGTYGGFPAVKIQKFLKIQRALIDLPDMWKVWRKNSPSD